MASTRKTRWEDIAACLPHSRVTLLHGPPGTGKTFTALSAPDPATGGPMDPARVFIASMHYEATVAELNGHWMPAGDRFLWLFGPAMAAWKASHTGSARLIIDEVDKAPGSVWSALLALLNDVESARTTIPNPELGVMDEAEIAGAIEDGSALSTMRPGPGFHAVLTMNGDPRDLHPALLDRCRTRFGVYEPHPGAIARVLATLGAAGLPAHSKIEGMIRESATQPDDERRVGLRNWIAFAELAAKVGPEVAARAVMESRAGDFIDGLCVANGGPLSGPAPTTKEKAPATPTASPAPVPASPSVSGGIIGPVGPAGLPAPGHPHYRGTYYTEKVPGKRGNPARISCPSCARASGKKSEVNAVGELECGHCGTVMAHPGTFTRRVFDPGTRRWKNDGTWK